MKIIVVNDSVYPLTMGGSHRCVFEQCRELSALGHDVVCVTANEAAVARVQEPGGFYLSTYRRSENSLAKALGFITEPARIIGAILREKGGEPVACLSVQMFPSLLGLIWNVPKLPPFYYVYHGSYAREMWTQLWPRFKRSLKVSDLLGALYGAMMIPVERWVLGHGRFPVVVLSNYTRRQLIDDLGVKDDRIVVVPGGCDTQHFSHSAEGRARIRARFGVDDDTSMIISVRRLEERMGLDCLIEAYADLRQRSEKKVKLVIVGKGSQRDYLERFAYERGLSSNELAFAGFVPDAELPDFYSAADLFVMPSLAVEGFGLPVIEAMSCGVPVLATSGGGHSDLVAAIAPQCVVPQATARALADALVDIFSGRTKLPDRSACESYARQFSWGRYCSGNLAVIDRVLAQKSPPAQTRA
ncbi:glycosyltransferase involved in cell wall biosynthesis [Rhizomicrobium palustre]|uniref:Glycosyltransferase involved in cell wall biosynthesis n=1 Tax=Rhizomicrobium palustre TaxID=189966 RepID=A0A846MV78_9PROT|nr:glycosyltransferase family 4 protein [Rhizomicrobium palustre]NIK86917.1 glycosyltransferase involved in cell wall biosynthesis [Rhizomicrobium palustre]